MLYQSNEFVRKPENRRERWVLVLFACLIGLPLLAEIFTNFTPLKLTVLLVPVFWGPLLVLHELGHAVMARLVGWRVRRIVLGIGKIQRTFLLGETKIDVRYLPIEGFVQSVPGNLRFPRLKLALIYLAGPGVELLLAFALIRAYGSETTWAASTRIDVILAQGLVLTALLGAGLNLLPLAASTEAGEIVSDGLGIVICPFLPNEHFRTLMTEGEDSSEVAFNDVEASGSA